MFKTSEFNVIKILKIKDNLYSADLLNLPGSPNLGYGITAEDSVAVLLFNLMLDNDFKKYIDFKKPIKTYLEN